MKYMSTRGLESGLSFEDVLFSGYATDKGLYMPESVPTISSEEMVEWQGFSYPEIVYHVLRKFVDRGEVPDSDLKVVVEKSMKKFSTPEVIPVVELKRGLRVFELFHGRTLAFKDLAMTIVIEFLNYFLTKRKRHITALVGTSGDTGGSAIESIRGIDTIDVIVLYPKDQVTKLQELQMATVADANVHVYEVEGTSDDLDVPIKECFGDEKFVSENDLISVNSINWVRICAQICHHFYAYFKSASELKEKQLIIVPSGAAGNITAGCIANQMGLPVQFVAAVNENDIVARTLESGDFSVRGQVHHSLASAMNIQIPYNVERIFFLFCGRKTSCVAKIMEEFESSGSVQIPNGLLENIKQVIIGTHVASNEDITAITKRVYDEENYTLCPHSAVGAGYHFKKYDSGCRSPRSLLATASPAKFPEATNAAGVPLVTRGIEHLKEMEKKSILMKKGQDWLSIVKACCVQITQRRKEHSNA